MKYEARAREDIVKRTASFYVLMCLNVCLYSQWTVKWIKSSIVGWFICKLWTRHAIAVPSSSWLGRNESELKVTFPSGDWVWRTDASSSLWFPFHQVICAGGREPVVRQTSSLRTPEDKARVGAIIVTSSGFTVERVVHVHGHGYGRCRRWWVIKWRQIRHFNSSFAIHLSNLSWRRGEGKLVYSCRCVRSVDNLQM